MTEEDFKAIAELMLNELRDSMADKAIKLYFDDALLECLTKKSFSQAYGARNLRRLIQKEIEDNIASEMISNYSKQVSTINLSVDNDKIIVFGL